MFLIALPRSLGIAHVCNLPAVAGQGVTVPSTALLYRDNGPAVALVGPDNKVTIHPVKIAHDLGANIEIASGVTPQDKIADNPPENIATGDTVKIASPKAANAKG